MAHDVFISYATPDKPIADAVCATLERRGIRCWIAPRDVIPGTSYGGSIVDAIDTTRAVVFVLSSQSNSSPYALREVERAVSYGKPVVPLRIEDVRPSRDLELFVSSQHWLDALSPPLEHHIERLADMLGVLLLHQAAAAVRPEPPTHVEPPAPVESVTPPPQITQPPPQMVAPTLPAAAATEPQVPPSPALDETHTAPVVHAGEWREAADGPAAPPKPPPVAPRFGRFREAALRPSSRRIAGALALAAIVVVLAVVLQARGGWGGTGDSSPTPIATNAPTATTGAGATTSTGTAGTPGAAASAPSATTSVPVSAPSPSPGGSGARQWSVAGTWTLSGSVDGVAVDSSDNIFLSFTGDSQIHEWLSNPPQIVFLGARNQFSNPGGIARDSRGNVYVADTDNNVVQILPPDGSTAKRLRSDRPQGVALDSHGNLYITELGSSKIQEYQVFTGGDFAATSSECCGTGSRNGLFDRPYGLAIDRWDHLWIADLGNNRIQVLSPAGDFLANFGVLGSGLGQFNEPRGIAIDGQGNVYVTDTNNNRVQELVGGAAAQQPTQNARWTVLPGPTDNSFDSPDGITVGSSGSIYVADVGNKRLMEYSASGSAQ